MFYMCSACGHLFIMNKFIVVFVFHSTTETFYFFASSISWRWRLLCWGQAKCEILQLICNGKQALIQICRGMYKHISYWNAAGCLLWNHMYIRMWMYMGIRVCTRGLAWVSWHTVRMYCLFVPWYDMHMYCMIQLEFIKPQRS